MAEPTDRELQGAGAVVTGSSSGIGRAIALELAEAGAAVLIHCRQARAAANRVAAEVRARGGRSTVVIADLVEPAGCETLVAEAWAALPGVQVWVNNAGADILTRGAHRLAYEDKLRALWAVDVAATIRLCRAVGRRMQEAGGGVILNMGWDKAESGMEGDSGELFAAAKGAVMCFSRSLAVSLAPAVRVNCLAPGWIRTAWGEAARDAWQERVRRETPLGRWGTPEDVARVARFLASPAAAFLTGQTFRINGGVVR